MRWRILFAAAALVASPSHASSFLIGAVEDLPGTSGAEHLGDFNDLIFSMMGDVSVNAPGGFLTSLSPGLLSQHGPIFWDNPSLGNMNIGYCLLGNPACVLSGIGSVKYLAGIGGTQLLNQTLESRGEVTFQILGQFAAYASISSLGWCDVTDCVHTQHALFSPGGPSSVTVTPGAAFALYFTNGIGQFYGSRAADNINESTGQPHFAFFTDPPADIVPEPATLGQAALGLGLGIGLWYAGRSRRKRSR